MSGAHNPGGAAIELLAQTLGRDPDEVLRLATLLANLGETTHARVAPRRTG